MQTKPWTTWTVPKDRDLCSLVRIFRKGKDIHIVWSAFSQHSRYWKQNATLHIALFYIIFHNIQKHNNILIAPMP